MFRHFWTFSFKVSTSGDCRAFVILHLWLILPAPISSRSSERAANGRAQRNRAPPATPWCMGLTSWSIQSWSKKEIKELKEVLFFCNDNANQVSGKFADSYIQRIHPRDHQQANPWATLPCIMHANALHSIGLLMPFEETLKNCLPKRSRAFESQALNRI